MPQAAGQVKNLIFLVKINFFPMYSNIFGDAGQVPILRYFEACTGAIKVRSVCGHWFFALYTSLYSGLANMYLVAKVVRSLEQSAKGCEQQNLTVCLLACLLVCLSVCLSAPLSICHMINCLPCFSSLAIIELGDEFCRLLSLLLMF